tara:strand:- start:158 stop:535 length:378 start_codon:yes stop_codon:yes gene_type:complete
MTEIDALGAWVPTEIDDIKDSELWSLDATLTDFILPRIKAFRKMERHGHPVFEKDIKTNSDSFSFDKEREEADWENILFDIETGFEIHKKLIADSVDTHAEDPRDEEIMRKGLRLFAEHYDRLWN